MIALCLIESLPTWVISLLSALLGAVIGGLASYFANYALKKKEWAANAAILRKDQVYSPVYDELVSLVDELESQDGWLRIPKVRALEKWRELSRSSLAIGLPKALTQRLNDFVKLCDYYVDAERGLIQQIIDAFPDTHLGQEDYVVPRLLVGRMLMGFKYQDFKVIDHIREQRGPQSPDLLRHWTQERFAEARKTIEGLSRWTSTKQFHDQYVKELYILRDDLGKRIRRIDEKYQQAEPDL